MTTKPTTAAGALDKACNAHRAAVLRNAPAAVTILTGRAWSDWNSRYYLLFYRECAERALLELAQATWDEITDPGRASGRFNSRYFKRELLKNIKGFNETQAAASFRAKEGIHLTTGWGVLNPTK